ncbi:MAG: beta strand repeat-containing protein, partial [Dolichospermum sp.]
GANLTGSPASGNVYSYNGSSWGTTGGTTSAGSPNVTTESGITSGNTIWTVAMPAAVPDIALADNVGGQVAAGTITKNTTNNIIYNFQLGVTTANATLNSVAFATTNSASDVSNYKLYYASSNSFGSASQIGSSITTSLGTGTHTFTSLSQVVNSGATGYFWIVSDVPTGATPGNTIVVSAITTSDITVASGNKTGSTSAGGTQTIIAAPTVTTNAAGTITTTSVILNGTVNANASSTTASFDYGTTVSYGTNVVADQSPITGTSNDAITKTVSSLGTNTLYHFRAKGVNSAGTTNGSDAEFTTLSNAPTVGSGNAETSVGFTANWTAPTNDGSETFTYTVEVDNDNAFGSVDATYSSIASGTLSQVVTGLASGTTYYFRVKAVNAGGSSAWSSVSAGVTTTSSVAPTVTTTSISSVTLTTASGGGNVTSDGGDAVTARGVVYNTSGNPTLADNFTTNGTGTGTYSSSLTSLSNNTTYYVKAYATNGVGTSYGSEVSFTTLVAEPTQEATSVTFGTRTTTSLVVNFSGGNGGRRIVVVRPTSAVSFTPTDGVSPSGVDADFSNATNQGSNNKIVYDGTGSTVTVTGLTANTTYHIAVFEYNNNSASVPNYYAVAATSSQATYNPTITASVSSLSSFGNVVSGANSSSQTYTVSGVELSSSISVLAPSGFAVSLDDADYSVNPIVLTRDGSDAVATTTIYVRFSPGSANGANSGNVANTATSATTQNVAVSGNAISAEPTTNGSISFGATTSTSIVLNLPTVGDGSNRIIVAKSGSAVDATPADGVSYTANAAFASGSQLGTGNYVVYNGTGSGSSLLTVTGLTSGTTYHFAVYEYNVNTGTSQNYLLTGAATNSQATNSASNATDAFRTAATGDWNNTSTWESFTNGSWMAATLTPDASASAITILNTHTVTVTASVSVDEVTVNSGGQITINSGQTLTIADGTGTDLTVNGTLVNSGTLTITGTGTVGAAGTYEHNLGNLTIPTFTWTSGSTLNLTGTWGASSAGTTIATLSPTSTYQNVTINIGNPTADSYISLGSITIGGKLKVMGTGSGAVLAGTSTTLFSCASYEQTGGIFYANRQASGDRGITVSGNVDITGGIFYLKMNATSSNHTSIGR